MLRIRTGLPVITSLPSDWFAAGDRRQRTERQAQPHPVDHAEDQADPDEQADYHATPRSFQVGDDEAESCPDNLTAAGPPRTAILTQREGNEKRTIPKCFI